jgi:hypothetical protein
MDLACPIVCWDLRELKLIKWTCKSVNPIGQYTICFYFYKVIDIVSFESEYNLWCNSDVNNIWGVKIKSRQVYFLKELKTKNNVRKNSKRSLRASYLHDKALQTLFREDNFQNFTIAPINQWMQARRD